MISPSDRCAEAEDRIAELEKERDALVSGLRRIANLEDAPDIDVGGDGQIGLYCGVEERDCQDRYQGADYGHAVGCERALEWASQEAELALAEVKPKGVPQ